MKIVRAKISISNNDIHLLSLRDVEGSRTGFCKGLVAAGFKAGDEVVVISAEEFKKIFDMADGIS